MDCRTSCLFRLIGAALVCAPFALSACSLEKAPIAGKPIKPDSGTPEEDSGSGMGQPFDGGNDDGGGC
ncbi:MAG: hypothetical protein KC416_03885, partial [Myxococcales bacterium]|nr:hypothetical protein [Myxococcales bacterium]